MPDEDEEQEEDCEECDLKDVPVGITHEICKLSDETDDCECDDLFNQVNEEEISVDEYIDKVEQKVKDDPNAQQTLLEVRKFYDGAKKKYGKQ